MAPRKTATATATAPDDAATAPADLGIDLSDQATRESIEKAATDAAAKLEPGILEPGIVTEDQGEGDASGDWPDVDYLPLYPVNEAGVPDSGTELFPGDDVAFVLDFLEHLAPEQFDRAKQRFMQAANEERARA